MKARVTRILPPRIAQHPRKRLFQRPRRGPRQNSRPGPHDSGRRRRVHFQTPCGSFGDSADARHPGTRPNPRSLGSAFTAFDPSGTDDHRDARSGRSTHLEDSGPRGRAPRRARLFETRVPRSRARAFLRPRRAPDGHRAVPRGRGVRREGHRVAERRRPDVRRGGGRGRRPRRDARRARQRGGDPLRIRGRHRRGRREGDARAGRRRRVGDGPRGSPRGCYRREPATFGDAGRARRARRARPRRRRGRRAGVAP